MKKGFNYLLVVAAFCALPAVLFAEEASENKENIPPSDVSEKLPQPLKFSFEAEDGEEIQFGLRIYERIEAYRHHTNICHKIEDLLLLLGDILEKREVRKDFRITLFNKVEDELMDVFYKRELVVPLENPVPSKNIIVEGAIVAMHDGECEIGCECGNLVNIELRIHGTLAYDEFREYMELYALAKEAFGEELKGEVKASEVTTPRSFSNKYLFGVSAAVVLGCAGVGMLLQRWFGKKDKKSNKKNKSFFPN